MELYVSFIYLIIKWRVMWFYMFSTKNINVVCRGKKERKYWYIMHWIVGTTISLVGIINIYTGLRAYHKRTLKSTKLWTILFTIQVSILALLFLFQDKLNYLQKQTLILPTTATNHSSSMVVSSIIINPQNDHIPQSHTHHKDLIPVSSAKSNALASLFDWSIILLFLTF